MDNIDLKNLDENIDLSKIDVFNTKLINVDLDFSKVPWWMQPFVAASMLYASGGLSEKSAKELQDKYKEKYGEGL